MGKRVAVIGLGQGRVNERTNERGVEDSEERRNIPERKREKNQKNRSNKPFPSHPPSVFIRDKLSCPEMLVRDSRRRGFLSPRD